MPAYQPTPGVALKLLPRRLVPAYCSVARGGGSADRRFWCVMCEPVGVTGTWPHGPANGAPVYRPPLYELGGALLSGPDHCCSAGTRLRRFTGSAGGAIAHAPPPPRRTRAELARARDERARERRAVRETERGRAAVLERRESERERERERDRDVERRELVMACFRWMA